MNQQRHQAFGLIVIGDEILFGGRQDSHLNHFRGLLGGRGLKLARCWMLPDEALILTDHLRFSLQRELPVFVCGGIGATPDDLTRECAAQAAGVPLVRHPEATALLEARFGDTAYPTRIRMAELPENCALIPNPYNQIPGFSVGHHYFLPGFPEMAWPMAEWVLDTYYPSMERKIAEASLYVLQTPESALVPIMEAFAGRFPALKLYSLPRIGEQSWVELGLRGSGELAPAIEALAQALREAQIPFRNPVE